MFEDINFANHMYTKISDLKLKYYDNDITEDNKLKYYDNDITEDNKLKYNITDNSNLDYLYYEENNKVLKKNKIKKNKIIIYILLFILFCFLNSYFFINIINSYNIQYNLSLIIRALIFLILYYLIKKYF
jgi:hypothetical protein